ncbi:proline-rich protein 36 [Anopheles nili]|uniref:proline-rich protein 36 n=1 Tax=Anopheles nili TaxID=185578 RepID=UPI00237AEF43|nr:proline-rich protein 36 [Anopheles nili]
MGKQTRSLPLGVGLGVALLLMALTITTTMVSGEFIFDDDFEDLIADESNVDEELMPGSVLLPSDVFNDGKPFLVERDPSTGALDFMHKKTGNQIDLDDAKPYESIKDSYVSDKKDVIVHHSTPNFHDFLNLPKMYSPENFVSISSSYANLKYQGINKGSNHRDPGNTHIVAATSATPAPPTVTTTSTVATPAATSTRYFYNRPQYGRPAQGGASSNLGSGSGGYYNFPATSGRPITKPTTTSTTSTTTTTTTTTPAPETTTETAKPTATPPKQLFTRYPYKSTIKNKYLETSEQTRKKFFLPSTLALPGPTTTTTTTTTTTERAPLRSSTYYAPSSIRPHWPSTGSTFQTSQTTPQSTTAPANPVRFVDDSTNQSKIKFTMPALKYEGSRPAPFRPMAPQQDSDRETVAASSASTKIELPKNPAVMSLSDIFSTIEQKKRLESQQAETNRVEEQPDEDEPLPTTAPAIVLLDGGPAQRPATTGPRIVQSIDLSDQYVRYEVHPQMQQQQQQQQFTQYHVQQPNGHRPQPPAMDAMGEQYVKYEVQQPQLNVVKYGAVPSMNSVVISPNQHSATFVLGSQQSVGSSVSTGAHPESGGHFVGSVSQDSASAAALSAGRPSYQMGQVLDLDSPHDPANLGPSVQVKPQDIIKTTSVRFPSESDDKYDNAPIISGTHKSEVLPPNGHSAPVRSDQMVVFPPNQDIASTLHEVSNRIVFDSPSAPSETLNRNELSVAPNPHYPSDLPEQLTPPSSPERPELGKPRPRPPVPSQGPPFRYSEIQRRPPTYPSDRPVHRPTLTLPNILPQFRPNAKISQGHPPYPKDSGVYRVPIKAGPPLRKPATFNHPPGTTALRRTPLPTRLMTRLSPSPSRAQLPPVSAELENRRYYRLPPLPPQPTLLKDRVYNIQPTRLQPPPPPPPPVATSSEKPNEPLEDSEFHRNPPQILRNILKDDLQQQSQQRPKLEPVVTLQMLQSKKQIGTSPPGQDSQVKDNTPQAPQQQPDGASKERPVYVVYPVKSTPVRLDGNPNGDALGHRGEQPPLVKVISPGTEYQNTPFSIASHFEQEPILTAKHRKPNPHGKLSFPYSLEKPDPVALTQPLDRKPEAVQDLAESDTEYNLGEEPSVIGLRDQDQDLISSKLQRFQTDSTPIAIAYTPTESSPLQRYSKPAFTGVSQATNNFYYSPYGETQTEVSYLKIDDVDEFGNPSRRYEQSFQAPFQASMSLDPVKVTNPYEGWAVVTSSPQALKLQQQVQQQPQQNTVHSESSVVHKHMSSGPNTIDRSDLGDTTSTGSGDEGDEHRGTPSETSSSSFDADSFQPELQGGFRPIYGADIKLSEQLNPDPQRSNVVDLFADEEPVRGTDEPPKNVTTKLQPVEPRPKVVKKEEPDSGMGLDLEAFFDQITKDYDDGEADLDDVTMSEETTNETIPREDDESQYRQAGEGRSNTGSVELVSSSSSTAAPRADEETSTKAT